MEPHMPAGRHASYSVCSIVCAVVSAVMYALVCAVADARTGLEGKIDAVAKRKADC